MSIMPDVGETREYHVVGDPCGKMTYAVLRVADDRMLVLLLDVEHPFYKFVAGAAIWYRSIDSLTIHSELVAP